MAKDDVVLITGASGFIGSAIIRKLAGGYTLVGLDRAGPPDPPAPAHAVDFDLGSDEAVRAGLEVVRERFGNRIASVIHLAAYYDISGEPNPLYDKVTVQGTRRLVKALKEFEVEQFVFASTMLVHRPTPTMEERIKEDSPIGPSWPYPESKVRTEALLREIHGNIPVVFLRIAGVYDDIGHSVFLAEQIAGVYEHRMKAHLYPGMLCAAQSSIHLDDLTEAFSKLVEHRKGLPGELPLLVGEPDALGYDEIQDIVHQAIHGKDWTTVQIPKAVAKMGVWLQEEVLRDKSFVKPWMVDEADAHYIVDISRARTLIGWEPRRSLRCTLPKIVEALKRDPVGWYRSNKLDPALVAWHASTPEAAADKTPIGSAEAAAQGGAETHQHQDQGAAALSGCDLMALMDRDEQRASWAHYATIGLGLWLATSPFVLGMADAASVPDAVSAVTSGRGLPPIEWRSMALAMSDVFTGLLIALFGFLSLSNRTAWFAQWASTFAGLWLLFAPLLFWAPSPAVYLNDMIVGAFVIAFSILVPMMPGMSMDGMMDQKVIPPGWTYCPSTAAQRLPIAVMGLLGLLISRHLTAYQFGHIDYAWEPLFAGSLSDPRNGTEEIITSYVSEAWPVPDAGLGAVAYLLEILMAVMGTRDRWRTMPWMVSFLAILVVPLGVTSIYFIIIQPVLLGTWSTLALLAALAMLIMIPFMLDEVIAMFQFLRWSRRRGKPLIRTFFKGGAIDAGSEYQVDTLAEPQMLFADATRGVTVPWTLLACVGIGIFLMLTRLLMGTSGSIANTHHVVGALVITVAVISMAEVARALRLLILPMGLWLIAAPWTSQAPSPLDLGVSALLGLALGLLSLPFGRRSNEHYDSWDAYIR
jgi:nucleoside-diphosphate-sugar epimerase